MARQNSIKKRKERVIMYGICMLSVNWWQHCEMAREKMESRLVK